MVTRRCHYCGKLFPISEVSAHTVVCEERELTCHHSWCRKIMKQRDLRAHMHECQQSRRTLCPKCGESFPASEMPAHRTVCDVVICDNCPERVIPRMLKYCPHTVLGKLQYRTGPFATERLRDRLSVVPSPVRPSPGLPPGGSGRNSGTVDGPTPLGAPSAFDSQPRLGVSTEHGKALPPLALSRPLTEEAGSPLVVQQPRRVSDNARPHVNLQVARMQHLWRWAKARAAIEDLLFRIVYKELDTKKETFSIFKAHDHRILDEEHRARQKKLKSAAPVQAIGAGDAVGHYFPAKPDEPITVDIVNRVIEDFTQKKPLPYHAVWRILTDANNILKSQPNIWRLAPPEGAKQVDGRWHSGGKVVIVGDLHGQLHDLLTILHDNALPSDRCIYVFNGDLVDRGHSGLEITLLLFLLMIVFPKHVALNRGNHECEYMNEEYGFDIEVQTKYDRNIFKLIQRCFCSLPLATVVGTRVFIVHGGLPRAGEVTFDEIDAIQRFRQIPMPELSQPEEDEIFQDLMWSDPHEDHGWVPSSRGVGAMFGPDVTSAFLKTNKLDLVVRSHEEFAKGHEAHHGGKLITVFSASNYDGPGSNLAATVTFMGDSAEHSFQTWMCTEEDFVDTHNNTTFAESALSLPPATPGVASLNATRTFTATSFAMSQAVRDPERFGHFCAGLLGNINILALKGEKTLLMQQFHNERRTRDEVAGTIRDRIFERRHRLLAYFTKIDRTQKGSVWKMEWVETMNVVLNLDLPWFFLRPSFTHTEPFTHRICYVQFLARFKNGMADLWLPAWRTAALAELYYILFGRRTHPVAKVLQTREDPIGYNEFCGLVRQISENVSDNELFQLYLALAMDPKSTENFVTGPSFIEAMTKAVEDFEADDQFDEFAENFCGWDLTTMDQLAGIITRLGPNLLHKIFELKRDEAIPSIDKFRDGISRLARGSKRTLILHDPAVRAIWDFLLQHCVDSDQGVKIDELLLAFAVRDYTSLRERREAFNELTGRLLGEDGSQPLRRRFSTTFVGFGPNVPTDGSPLNGTLLSPKPNVKRVPTSSSFAGNPNPGGGSPIPMGEPTVGMSAYAMRRANMTPTSLAQRRTTSMDSLGGSMDAGQDHNAPLHQDPSEPGMYTST